MSRLFFLSILSLSLCTQTYSQQVRHSIYLIGDAGKDTLPGPALQLLEDQLNENPNSTVLFLGDNIYPAGLEGMEGNKKQRQSELKLLSQLETTKNMTGHVFWVPGNHDWKAGRWKGHWLVKKEAEFVESYYQKDRKIKNDSGHVFMPTGGLPGPVMERVSDQNLDVIAIDIQWWLQDQFFHKVPREYGLSKRQMERRFLNKLDSLISLSNASGHVTMIAAHHPMFSNGHHGAAKQPFRFILNWVPPFQLFGLIGLNRAMVQDIPQPRYKRIRNKILKVLNKHNGLLYVSGHDHNLQYIKKENNHYLVSGAGSKRSSLSGDKYQAHFMNDQNYGFMRLDVMEDGKIKCHVFGHTKGGIIESFWLD